MAEKKLEAAKAELAKASEAVGGFKGTEPAERAKLELVRDEQLRRTQDEEKRYQIAKDLSDNLTVGYNTSEVIMARLMQTTNAKERVYPQAVSLLLDQRLGAHRAQGLVHRHVRPARIDADPERDEGGRVEEPGGARRDRRPGRRGGGEGRLRPDHPRRCGEEARGFRRHLPGALAARSSTRCASSRPRTRPRSATRSRTASAASPGSWPKARRCRPMADDGAAPAAQPRGRARPGTSTS